DLGRGHSGGPGWRHDDPRFGEVTAWKTRWARWSPPPGKSDAPLPTSPAPFRRVCATFNGGTLHRHPQEAVMRMHRSAPRSPTRRGLTLLAGLLALAGRSVGAQGQPAAQAGDSVPMELVFVVFPDTTAADQAMSKLTPAQQGYVE